MAGKYESVPEVPCGNTVALVGIDKFLMKQGTITTADDAHNIKMMKFTVSPVVRVAVSVQNVNDIQKLTEGLKKLSKSDPMVQCHTNEKTGEHIIAGCGELHVEICLKDLEDDFAKCPIKKGDPIVSYKETVTEVSSQVNLSKSANKHNRVFCKASPLDESLSLAIEDGLIGPRVDPKERTRILAEQFDWDRQDAHKLWCFGPETTGPNCVVNLTQGV